MKTAKGQILVMETIDTTVRTMRTLPMCTGEIPGASPYHITIPAGEVYRLPTDTAHYNIFILVEGQCGMDSDGTHADFAERVTFVPAPEAEMTLTAVTDVQLALALVQSLGEPEKYADALEVLTVKAAKAKKRAAEAKAHKRNVRMGKKK